MTEEKWMTTLSTTEKNNVGSVLLRKNNENSEVMKVKLIKNSKPYDLTALKVFFVTHFSGKDGLKVPIQKETKIISAKEGIFEFIFDEDCMQKVGRQEAYFEIYDYDKFLDTTQNFTYEILSSSRNMKADFTPYIETWEEAEKMLNEGTAKVLTDKTNKLESKKADITDVENRLEKKTDNETFVAITADMQRQIESTQSGMLGEFNSVEELNKDYPNGTKGYAVVWLDEGGEKVGYSYTYKNNNWVKGNVWNGVGVPDKSVGNKKLDVAGINIADTLKINDLPPIGSNIPNSSTRAYSEIININVGDTIGLDNYPGYQFAIFKASEKDSVIQGYSTYFYSEKKESIVVVLRREDNARMNGIELDVVSKKIYYANSKAITNYSIYEKETKKILQENGPISTFDKSYNDLLLENKVTNEYLTNSEEAVVEIGEFYQEYLRENEMKIIEDNDVLYYVVKTNNNNKDISELISFRQKNGNAVVKETKSEFVGNGIFFIKHVLNLELNQTNYQLLIDNRKGSERIEVNKVTSSLNYIFNDFKVKKISGTSTSEKSLYVTLSGSDSNDGESELGALKTFQKAIELGASTIYAERGVYDNQSIVVNDLDKLHIIPLTASKYDITNNYNVPLVVLNNGKFYFRNEEDIQKIQFEGNDRFKQVFINKTLPPKTTSSRPSFNAGVWQIHEALGKDILLEPVLSLIDCQSKSGTFFWDGTTLSINPKQTTFNISGFTIHNDVEVGINIKNVKDLKMNDISVNFSYSRNIVAHNCNILFQNVKTDYTVLMDSVSLDYSNGNLYNCISRYARNDGYNMHYFGDTHFWYCEGHYNGDDGISHHDGCTGSINFGHWSHNGKSGIAPTYGSIVHTTGNYCHNNPYNIYRVGEAGNQVRTVRDFDNVLKNATRSDYKIDQYYKVLSKGNIYNTIDGEENLIKLDS